VRIELLAVYPSKEMISGAHDPIDILDLVPPESGRVGQGDRCYGQQLLFVDRGQTRDLRAFEPPEKDDHLFRIIGALYRITWVAHLLRE